MAATEAADIAPAYQLLAAAVGDASLSTAASTPHATDARAELLAVLPALLGPLRAIVTKTNYTALLALATLSGTQLRKMKPEELRDAVKELFTDALARPAQPQAPTPTPRQWLDNHLAQFDKS